MPVAGAPGSEAPPDGSTLPSGYNASNTTAAIVPTSQRPPSAAAPIAEFTEQLARDELEESTRGELEAHKRGELKARDEHHARKLAREHEQRSQQRSKLAVIPITSQLTRVCEFPCMS
ncbi:hypothetical protein T492DRAFT_1131889 [Pavlovales sp. CCMP2436]|nr:hypothetical protein T492DRAFT_1131889 [Pavlovales sp. CCMP2436]